MVLLILFALFCSALAAPTKLNNLGSDMNVTEFKEAMAVLAHEVLDEYKAKENLDTSNLPKPNIADSDDIILSNRQAGVLDELFEGDILFTEKQLQEIEAAEGEDGKRARRQAIVVGATAWGTTSPIPYYFYTNVSPKLKQIFAEAVKFWSAKTCVRFVENNTAKDRVRVQGDGGCNSNVGRVGNEQYIHLGPGCETLSTATHEMEHMLGVYHTQSRGDRDNYVTVITANLQSGMAYNFDKMDKTTDTLGIPYEYGSNMHYSPEAFTKNGEDTLRARDARYQTSMRGHMPSFYDVSVVNKFYKCDDKCTSYRTTCYNGGVPDVNNCAKCRCPEGYGGTNCAGRPEEPYKIMPITDRLNSTSIEIGKYEDPEVIVPKQQYFIFEAPAGKKVEIRFTGIWSGMASGCQTAGIEVKTLNDHRPRGFRHCGTMQPKTYTSEGNRITILAWVRLGSLRTDFSYRYY